jgi:hypothetical protein
MLDARASTHAISDQTELLTAWPGGDDLRIALVEQGWSPDKEMGGKARQLESAN